MLLSFQFGEEDFLDDREEIEENAGNDAVFKSLFLQGLNQILDGEKYLCDLAINKGAIICTLEDAAMGSKARLLPRLKRLCEQFWEERDIWVRVAVSEVCETPSELNRFYDKTEEILRYGADSDKNVMFFEDYRDSRDYYYYPVNLEERLVSTIRNGLSQRMHDELQEVYEINLMERNISPSMMHYLVNDLQCTVFKALHSLREEVHIDESEVYRQLDQIDQEDDILLRFNRINKLFHYICEQVKEQGRKGLQLLKEQIEDYILANYVDPEMGLPRIAGDFGYSESYFSRIFKEMFEETFGNYLERVRIDRACQLLMEGHTVERIMECVGYGSIGTFRKAFKRMKGMTPQDYRMQKNTENDSNEKES